ncbi:MAG: hypothetical protein B7Y02_14865, partial [Rhodobacterales bacterium 17-64-5]
IGPHLAPGATVTDVGSVKQAVVAAVAPHLPEGVDFIPGHPMAGTEYSGPRSGFATLFVNRWWLLTPGPEVDRAAVDRLTRLLVGMGAKVNEMTPDHHDQVVAVVSHAPHLIAYTMVGVADHLAHFRPQPRPAGALAAGPMIRPQPRPAGALAAGPMIRPQPRPAALAVQTAQSAAARPSLRPMPRPDFDLKAVALMPAPQKPAASLKGALCQRPGLSGKVLPPIKARNKGCNVADPVLLSEISGVKLVPPATVDCEEARALSTWVATGLQPAFGGKIVRLNVVDSYAGRPRNNVPGKPVSVHGLGQAIDIAGFMTSDGRTYTVADNYGPEIKAAQKAGCGIFRTT